MALKEYFVRDLVIDDEYGIIDSNATIQDAAKKMKELGVPDLVVVEIENQKVLGVIADFDIVQNTVAEGKDVKTEILGNYIILFYTKNRGGFLSIGGEVSNILWTIFFIIIPIILLSAISIYIIKNKLNQPIFLILWTLVLSGGLGNIIDRIFQGKVIDFINVGIGSLRTGIFNFADLYIVFLLIIFILYSIIVYKKTRKLPNII